jgi:3-methyl-2-oxobutanoate hydroxymethyltransferase
MQNGKIPPLATKFVDMYALGVEGIKKYVDSVKAGL